MSTKTNPPTQPIARVGGSRDRHAGRPSRQVTRANRFGLTLTAIKKRLGLTDDVLAQQFDMKAVTEVMNWRTGKRPISSRGLASLLNLAHRNSIDLVELERELDQSSELAGPSRRRA